VTWRGERRWHLDVPLFLFKHDGLGSAPVGRHL
jgi:hypothetical protein